jgi:hypothetical protein
MIKKLRQKYGTSDMKKLGHNQENWIVCMTDGLLFEWTGLF